MASRQKLPLRLAKSKADVTDFERLYPEREDFLGEFVGDGVNVPNYGSTDERAWAHAEIDRDEDKYGFASVDKGPPSDV